MADRIICVDFDGVLHSYTSGWQGPRTIPDPPIPGALEWLLSLIKNDGVRPVIYSSRSKAWGGRRAMRRWLFDHYVEAWHRLINTPGGGNTIGSPWDVLVSDTPGWNPCLGTDGEEARRWARCVLRRLTFPTKKPAAFLTVDDRAWCFRGEYPSAEQIRSFQPFKLFHSEDTPTETPRAKRGLVDGP